jgi:hypothetical protein
MSLRGIKHAFLRLSAEEKVVSLGILIVLIGAFLPWYSVIYNFDRKSVTESGFSGDIGVIGFVVFILALLAGLALLGDALRFRLPDFGFKKEKIVLFLMGENAFLILLALTIYTKRSLEFTSAELRFGLYMALLGAIIGAFAAFAQAQKLAKKEVREFFGQDEDEKNENQREEQLSEPMAHAVPKKERASSKKKSQPAKLTAEDGMLSGAESPSIPPIKNEKIIDFDENDAEMPEVSEVIEEGAATEVVPEREEYPREPDAAKAAAEEEYSEDEVTEFKPEMMADEPVKLDQGSYFAREAGLRSKLKITNITNQPEPQAVEETNEMAEVSQKKTDAPSGSIDFYNDL